MALPVSRKCISFNLSKLFIKFLGIGKATAERLLREGATVAVFDINEEAGRIFTEEANEHNFTLTFCKVDVSDKQQCIEAVKNVAEANGGEIHYLVNCAVYFGSKGLNAEKEDWDKSFSVNVVGYANMVQVCYDFMNDSRSVDKSIVNIASTAAHRAQINRWTYSATKGAVVMMTKNMALDLSSHGIRVNSVSPAWVWSPEVAKVAVGGREKWEPIWGPYHLPRRLCETSEVASAVCFLLSEDASYVTGSDLTTDGGYCAIGPEGLGEHSNFAGTDY